LIFNPFLTKLCASRTTVSTISGHVNSTHPIVLSNNCVYRTCGHFETSCSSHPLWWAGGVKILLMNMLCICPQFFLHVYMVMHCFEVHRIIVSHQYHIKLVPFFQIWLYLRNLIRQK